MKITYKRSGVNIEKANSLIKKAKKLIDGTRVRGSMDSVGGFGGFFDPRAAFGKDPLLVASTDGVGTKLKIAQEAGKHDTIGIDLVAMCVNDLLCSGARPLFFLDYFACGKLKEKEWSDVIKGIVKGCREAGCALLGGETAEMPGMYPKGEYDLAGFSVGAVARDKAIDGKKIKKGDVLIGISSTGIHSNGYSLVRKLFSKKELVEKKDIFLSPTAIYVKTFFGINSKARIKGAAHITGGGFYDNVPRMLPEGMKAVIKKGAWKEPTVFGMIRKRSGLGDKEMYRTFNMGIGMVLAVSPGDAEKAVRKGSSKNSAYKACIIGYVDKGKRSVEIK
ncbi:MAG: phosphoribosylformylglycinamidine cyclo-ligase [Candidatus Omnitrophica bacterium]|nr:phosphoribosylformylglycinamidine cyclo-ligase [Candidatus Omnitrophota bacterium]